jgi:hypothetical protein
LNNPGEYACGNGLPGHGKPWPLCDYAASLRYEVRSLAETLEETTAERDRYRAALERIVHDSVEILEGTGVMQAGELGYWTAREALEADNE